MSDVIGEFKLRKKNQTTVPQKVIDILNLKLGDFIRWIEDDNGNIIIRKAITRLVPNNKLGGDESGMHSDK